MQKSRHWLRVTFIMLTLVVLLVPSSVNAITPEQKRVLDSGSLYFNVEDYGVCNNIGIVNGSVDRFLQVLAFQESSGNPQADASPASTASGKYQYLNGTWASVTSTYYPPASAYIRAKLAPESMQDAVAYLEYSKKFKDYGNDLFKLAVSHFYPAANNNPALLDTIPGNNSLTPRQYAERLINNIGEGLGSNIPLRYQEAPEFTAWLQRIGGAPPNVNSGGGCASSATASAVVAIAEREFASGANQADGSNTKYGGAPSEPWCAYFVSWVFNEAGKPFEGGTIAAVDAMQAYAQEYGYYAAKGQAGFVPQPGDVVIYNEDLSPFPSHVNIVVSYDAATNTYTSIGGNESNTIKKSTFSADLPAITGFMRIP